MMTRKLRPAMPWKCSVKCRWWLSTVKTRYSWRDLQTIRFIWMANLQTCWAVKMLQMYWKVCLPVLSRISKSLPIRDQNMMRKASVVLSILSRLKTPCRDIQEQFVPMPVHWVALAVAVMSRWRSEAWGLLLTMGIIKEILPGMILIVNVKRIRIAWLKTDRLN